MLQNTYKVGYTNNYNEYIEFYVTTPLSHDEIIQHITNISKQLKKENIMTKFNYILRRLEQQYNCIISRKPDKHIRFVVAETSPYNIILKEELQTITTHKKINLEE